MEVFRNTELATWSQLIVNESQEAILVRNGQATDVFGPGHYVLSTDNIPVLQALINLPFGKRSPFSAEVWFINKAFSLDIKWGTPSPIQIQDPKYRVFIPVRAFGQFGIQVVDSKRFLIKLVGTMRFFNRNTLTDYFRGLFITRVKDRISQSLIKSQVSILEINAHLNELSGDLREALRAELAEYGIDLVTFFINDINVPESDPAVKQLKAALAKRAEMDILGYNYQQERTFDTLETAADNQGTARCRDGIGHRAWHGLRHRRRDRRPGEGIEPVGGSYMPVLRHGGARKRAVLPEMRRFADRTAKGARGLLVLRDGNFGRRKILPGLRQALYALPEMRRGCAGGRGGVPEMR